MARRLDVLEAAAQELRRAGGNVLAVGADVTNPSDVQRLVKATLAEYGRLDILVNNAGTGRANSFEAVGDETWHADLDVKLHAAIYTTRAALPHLKVRGGRIINVTTPAGKTPGGRSLPTSVSRAAGIALTKALSKDLAEYGILVNTVCVGLIKSAQHERRSKIVSRQNRIRRRFVGQPGMRLYIDQRYSCPYWKTHPRSLRDDDAGRQWHADLGRLPRGGPSRRGGT